MSRILGENRNVLLIGGLISAIIVVCGCSFVVAIPILLSSPPKSPTVAQQPTAIVIAPTVIVPPAQTTAPITNSTPVPVCVVRADWPVYTVSGGDTLSSIALRSNTTVSALVEANCLTNSDNLQVGQQLRVPTIPIPPPTNVLNTSNAERLNLAPGTTELLKVGAFIAAQSPKDYVIGVEAGQILILDLNSREGNYLSISVIGAADGNVVKTLMPPIFVRPVAITSTQDYLIRVNNTGNATVFDLSVGLPIRINFATGATSATQSGPIFGAKGSTNLDYIINGQAGQTMTVSVNSPNNDVVLGIYGVDDGHSFVNTSAGQTSWTMQLPAHEDYVIQLQARGGTTTYAMVTALTN